MMSYDSSEGKKVIDKLDLFQLIERPRKWFAHFYQYGFIKTRFKLTVHIHLLSMGCEPSQLENESKLQVEPEAKPSFVENVRSFRVREQPKKKEAKKSGKESDFEDIPSDVKLQFLVVHVKKVFDKYDSGKGFLDEEDFTKLLKN